MQKVLLILGFPALLAACEADPGEPPAAHPLPAVAATAASSCAQGSFWRGRLVGAVDAAMDWSNGRLSCAAGPRPDGKGARMRFAAMTPDGDDGLAVILALPDLERGVTGSEFRANVTVILEGEARFFSTQNRELCWADIERHERVGADDSFVAGRLYCIDPLAEVNGSASVTLEDSEFAGRIRWSPS